ncbi:MAG: dihydrofolate reductase [Eubacteriales bacterium]
MKAIVLADKNWAIGNQNHLLISIPADMKRFQQQTEGGIVVLGHHTQESLPGGEPLRGRTNIVLSGMPDLVIPGAEVVHSRDELFRRLRGEDSDKIYVAGGGKIYELLLPYCDTVYVTRVDFAYTADVWFPNLDYMPEWELAEESEEQTYFDAIYTFCTYRKKYHTELPEG